MTRTRCSGCVGSGCSRTVAAALFFLIVGGEVTAAQSLGDVAQRAAERRKQAAAGRVFTNGDLVPVDESAPPPAPVPTAAAPAPSPETPAPKPAATAKPTDNPGVEPVLVKGSEKRDEQYWRKLMRDLRARVAKLNADIAAQEARLAEINAGPQTPTSIREREVIPGTVTRLQRDARFVSEELTRFLTRARLAKVPEDWIR